MPVKVRIKDTTLGRTDGGARASPTTRTSCRNSRRHRLCRRPGQGVGHAGYGSTANVHFTIRTGMRQKAASSSAATCSWPAWPDCGRRAHAGHEHRRSSTEQESDIVDVQVGMQMEGSRRRRRSSRLCPTRRRSSRAALVKFTTTIKPYRRDKEHCSSRTACPAARHLKALTLDIRGGGVARRSHSSSSRRASTCSRRKTEQRRRRTSFEDSSARAAITRSSSPPGAQAN